MDYHQPLLADRSYHILSHAIGNEKVFLNDDTITAFRNCIMALSWLKTKRFQGYSFTGPEIPFDPANVMPLFPNTKAAMLPEGSEERRMADSFNNSYNTLLNGLHITFNGTPDFLDKAIGVMFDLRLTAQKLGGTPFPGKAGFTIGPPYEFIPQEKIAATT